MGDVIKFPKLIHLKGNMNTREVWLNGQLLTPKESLKTRMHADEFCWGYGGSGPAQLSLAIMLKFYSRLEAQRLYQHFKRDIIAALPQTDFDIKLDIDDWRRKFDERGF